MQSTSNTSRGFTLLELLIVIALIAILAAVAFASLNPLTRLRDARDSRRWADISAIMTAIKLDQIDHGGAYLGAIQQMTTGSIYMIVNGSNMSSGCDDNNASCDTDVSGDTNCVNLTQLVQRGYLGTIPYSPAGSVTWDAADTNGNEGTGYTLMTSSTGSVTVRSCESENTGEIFILH